MKNIGFPKISPNTLFTVCIILPFVLGIIILIIAFGQINDNKRVNKTPTRGRVDFTNAKKVVKKGQGLHVFYKDGSEKSYTVAKDFILGQSGLDLSRVEVQIENDKGNSDKISSIFLSFLPVLLIGLPFIFWFIMLYHSLAVNKNHRIIWALLIVLTFSPLPIGAIAYFFIIYRPSKYKESQ